MLTTRHDRCQFESLDKSLEGRDISKNEALELFISLDSEAILSNAKRIRDKFKPGPITYSRKIFFNVMNLCRDFCSYCTYRKAPSDNLVSMMTPYDVLRLARTGKRFRCTEALLVTGERPEQRYPQARSWLHSLGHSSTIDYLSEISELILQKTGLLPHTNAGSMTKKEMSLLKHTNVSLGVMLESSSEKLKGKGMPHEFAPSKDPKVRLKTLESAGELSIPITTGLLVGIGEEPSDIVDSLYLIKEINRKYGHIQEVIIQNFTPKQATEMANTQPPSADYFLKTVGLARIILKEMNIQVPPNLSPHHFGKFLEAGINDWGGISPVTIDHVNPEFPWPSITTIDEITRKCGFSLRARLPIYPEFIFNDSFISQDLKSFVKPISDEFGLVPEGYLL